MESTNPSGKILIPWPKTPYFFGKRPAELRRPDGRRGKDREIQDFLLLKLRPFRRKFALFLPEIPDFQEIAVLISR